MGTSAWCESQCPPPFETPEGYVQYLGERLELAFTDARISSAGDLLDRLRFRLRCGSCRSIGLPRGGDTRRFRRRGREQWQGHRGATGAVRPRVRSPGTRRRKLRGTQPASWLQAWEVKTTATGTSPTCWGAHSADRLSRGQYLGRTHQTKQRACPRGSGRLQSAGVPAVAGLRPHPGCHDRCMTPRGPACPDRRVRVRRSSNRLGRHAGVSSAGWSCRFP